MVGASFSEIIDVVLGNDERDFLEFRSKYLEGVVATTYVGESRLTYSLFPKKLNFHDLAKKPPDKNWVPIEIPLNEEVISKGSWAFENYSRNWLVRNIAERHPDALLIVSDLDEIPSRSQLSNASIGLEKYGVLSLPMKTAYRCANLVWTPAQNYWTKAKLVLSKNFDFALRNGATGQRLRPAKWAEGEPGVHLSYVGFSKESLRDKLNAFAHTEFAALTELPDSYFNFCDNYGLDHLGRIFKWGNGVFRFEQSHELNEVQREAVQFRPQWLGLGVAHPRSERKRAAAVVHLTVKSHQRGKPLDDFEMVVKKSGRHFALRVLMSLSQALNSWRLWKSVVRFG